MIDLSKPKLFSLLFYKTKKKNMTKNIHNLGAGID